MITRDDWLRALAEAGYHDETEHDENALTVDEFSQLMGIQRTTAESRLRVLVAKGKAVKTRKRGLTSYGRRISFVAYRLAKPEKKQETA